WVEEIARNREETFRRFRERTGATLADALRRVLTDLADADLESRVIGTFRRRLADSSPSELPAAGGETVVSTDFPVGADQRQAFTQDVERTLKPDAVRFEPDEALVCGVAIRSGSWRLAWDVADYLEALESDVALELDGVGRAGHA